MGAVDSLGACKRKTASAPDAGASVIDAGASAALPPVKTTPLAPARPDAREGSAILVASGRIFVADEDAHAIVSMPASSSSAGDAIVTKLEGRPAQMVVTEGLLAVALRDEHVVAFYGREEKTGALVRRGAVPVADEPVTLARVPKSDALVSVSAIGHSLCVVSPPREESTPEKPAKPARCFELAREPRGVTTSEDGKTAVVAHAAADGASVVSLDDGSVKLVGLGRPRFEKNLPKLGVAATDFSLAEIRLTRFARQGFAAIHLPAASDDTQGGERIVIPHALVAPGDKESTSGNGYGSGVGSGSTFTFDETMTIFPTVEMDVASLVATSPASSFDVEVKNQGLLIPEVVDHEARCFLPRAAVAADRSLYVACVGSLDVQRFDVDLTPKTAKKPRPARVTKLPTRFGVKGGPTALALDEKGTLFAFSQHDRTISVFEEPSSAVAPRSEDRSKSEIKPARVIDLAERSAEASVDGAFAAERVRRGRALFHASRDERMTKDRRACATCHPDGRDDGLVRASPEGFRQTIFLAGRLDRKSPYGWHGKHASIAEHLKITVRNLGGTGLPDDAIGDLEAFVRAMPPPPRAKRPLSAEAEAGRRIFHSSETRCSTCHAESQGFGGVKAENVSSGTMTDTVKEFLVPSLRFIGASAPYYHDGRFTTLDDLIVAADGKMGHTKHLSPAEVASLAAFLKTL